ncbi:MAG: hypothetical protein R3Y24_17175 [Eubacteriales bacterium]
MFFVDKNIVIQKIIRDYKLKELLGLYFSERDLGLFLDLATYSIITEKNVGQYYPDYAYNHPLLSPNMKVYSDSTVSDFLQYGYKKIGFILDRGYFSKKNIEYMDECGYSFVLMIKGMASLVEEIVSEKLGSFE